MFEVLFLITSVLFYIFVVANSLSWLKLWEEKGYNLPRVLTHLKDTRQGRRVLFGPTSIGKWILIFSYGLTIFINIDFYFHILVSAYYLFLIILLGRKIYQKEFYLPTVTPVLTIIIVFLSLGVISLFYLVPPLDKYLWLMILDRITPVIIALFVFMFSIFFDFSTDVIINKALRKIKNHKNLLIIAVVGSYGKGTTKEFIARVLKTKFNVLETRSSFNNTIGIAKTIISDLTPKKQIFIAEMEDHRYGDIGEMCNLVPPQITVVTGINDLNFSMFGSMKKIIDSKYQAIEFLGRDGIAVFNGNNSNALSLYSKTKNKKFTYLKEIKKGSKADIKAFDVKVAKFSMSFSVLVNGKKYNFNRVKLIGRQNVENLLPAIFIGLHIGIDFSAIKDVVNEIRPLPGAMDPKITANKTVIVDDTHNSSLTSVLRAVDYMKLYDGKRILVLEPLVELGKNSKEDHYQMGLTIGGTCDYLFLTNDNFKDAINRGIKNSKGKCRVMIQTPIKIADFIKKECSREDIVVFEGNQAGKIMSLLSYESVY